MKCICGETLVKGKHVTENGEIKTFFHPCKNCTSKEFARGWDALRKTREGLLSKTGTTRCIKWGERMAGEMVGTQE